MNRKEALKAMIDGKVVFRPLTNYSFKFSEKGLIYSRYHKNGWIGNSTGLCEDDYEIYKEPKVKKLVKFYKFYTPDRARESEEYYTGDGRYYYKKGEKIRTTPSDTWIITSCFMEVEVEG